MNIHIHRNGQNFGPYALEEVNGYLAEGSMSPRDMAFHEGLADWTPLAKIDGIIVPDEQPTGAPAGASSKGSKGLFIGGGGENHHQLSHHGGDAEMLRKLGVVDRFHLTKLARFMTFLKSTSEAEGNMIDRTMILFGSGMNSGAGGGHSPKNLPLLIAGGHKLGLKHGQHLAHDEKYHPPLTNVHLTMAQAMGLETDSFSDSGSTLTGLT